MPNLDNKANKINIVISDKDNNLNSEKIKRVLELYICSYAFILHNCDINEDGEFKTNHYHIVMYDIKRVRLSTLINYFSSSLEINPFSIQIEKCEDIVGSIQYLIHKNDNDKYKYSPDLIFTNINNEELKTLLEISNNAMSLDRIINIVETSKSRIDIIRAVGLSYYHIYRHVINDIINSIKKGID